MQMLSLSPMIRCHKLNQITPTILNYLNEDCWRAVFDYMPGRDIIQSERVSQRWQTVVLTYLRGVRIGIEHPYPTLRSNELHRNTCWALARDLPSQSFERWTSKLGASLVSTYCPSEECLRIIGENCPNLDAVKLLANILILILSAQYRARTAQAEDVCWQLYHVSGS